MSSLNADMVAEVKERAIKECLELALSITEAADGIGDGALDRNQRILRFMQRAQSGALDVMKDLRPDLYHRAIREYLADIEASPLVGSS